MESAAPFSPSNNCHKRGNSTAADGTGWQATLDETLDRQPNTTGSYYSTEQNCPTMVRNGRSACSRHYTVRGSGCVTAKQGRVASGPVELSRYLYRSKHRV